jgi:hypothetical protein
VPSELKETVSHNFKTNDCYTPRNTKQARTDVILIRVVEEIATLKRLTVSI